MGVGGMGGAFNAGSCPFSLANCPFMTGGRNMGLNTGVNANGTALPAAPTATAAATQDLNRNGIPDSQEAALNFSNQLAGARTTTGPAAATTTPPVQPVPTAAPLAPTASTTGTTAPPIN